MKSPPAIEPPGVVVETKTFELKLARDESPGPAALAVAWVVGDGGASLDATGWLRGEEVLRGNRITHAGVRCDFLLGRMAAKTALSACLPGVPPAAWEIQRGCWHQPLVRGPAAGLAVTLAHHRGVAVALAYDDRGMAGIDLEPLDRDIQEAVASQVSAGETVWAQAATGAPGWHLLWTAREALGKFMRSGLLRPQVLAATHDWTRCAAGWSAHFAPDDLITARSVVAKEYAVTWALPKASLEPAAADALAVWLQAALDRVR